MHECRLNTMAYLAIVHHCHPTGLTKLGCAFLPDQHNLVELPLEKSHNTMKRAKAHGSTPRLTLIQAHGCTTKYNSKGQKNGGQLQMSLF